MTKVVYDAADAINKIVDAVGLNFDGDFLALVKANYPDCDALTQEAIASRASAHRYGPDSETLLAKTCMLTGMAVDISHYDWVANKCPSIIARIKQYVFLLCAALGYPFPDKKPPSN